MSNICCKQFQGWIKSFTNNERILAILEAILVVVFIVSLIFLVLHLIACAYPSYITGSTSNVTTTLSSNNGDTTTSGSPTDAATSTNKDNQPIASESVQIDDSEVATSAAHTQSTSEKVCSWTPSAKTTPVAHYYIGGHPLLPVHKNDSLSYYIGSMNNHAPSYTTYIDKTDTDTGNIPSRYVEEVELSDMSDGEDAEEEYRSFVMALVKLKPHRETVFGCILTIVSEHWTLTAASCVEAIEELDSFIIMERYGANDRGPLHPVRDVHIHPLHGARNRSYDLAALRSADSLVARGGRAVPRASALDAALATVGGTFTVLGYGPFRSAGGAAGLRRVAVHRVSALACAGGGARRHVGAGRAAPALCCGALFLRGRPCRYCAGSPLLRAARLYGVMADNPDCGVSCEPRLYVNVAVLADWIGSVLRQ